MREARLSSAWLRGDKASLASLRCIDAGGPNSAELKSIAILGKHSGVGAMASATIAKDDWINGTTVKLLPLQVRTAYVVSDSTLKLKPRYHGPEITTMEKLMAAGVDKVSQHNETGAEITNLSARPQATPKRSSPSDEPAVVRNRTTSVATQ